MANPALNEKTISKLEQPHAGYGSNVDTQTMTVSGTINKAGILFVLLLAGAAVGWTLNGTGLGSLLFMGGAIASLILAFVVIFKQTLAPTLAPIYAVGEGLTLGTISAIFSASYPGIAANAASLTILVLFLMLGLYHFRILQATPRFMKIVFVSTMAIGAMYLVDLVASLMHHPLPMIHETGIAGILFSCLVVGVASANLIVDFGMIESAAARRAPKYFEWYSAFALMLTIVWLYMEILRLLSKISKR